MSKKSFVLRMEESTYKLLEKWANDEFRSVNGQIEFLLHESLINSGRKKKGESEEKPDLKKNSKGKE
ncbi:Arc family DNA binding domain-containing protein [Chryseobacterium sp.]|uniref:Arc family DNA binding domain-containing protein n=1 Tax=Chryseobacterium sp. TaxID=1871047 RepID=UPI0011C9A881|nr:Arc family DNA binding domain-containing protein [Chryseobacterium sp.]TXF79510.1 Arc family DNA binding domain-containing protein [Chryseobacterium sp.]